MRLPINKTYKLFIGGAFPRSESGRSLVVKSQKKDRPVANISRASRKDLREAVVTGQKAFEPWSKKTASNRGQILYRIAEILEHRFAEMIDELVLSGDLTPSGARQEIQTSVDRLMWYAGWADKVGQVFGTINPVATPHFNFSIPEPVGVVCAIAPDRPALLGLVTVIASVIVTGNVLVILASEKHPLPSIGLAEILSTSDVPQGVVNILTGLRAEIAVHMAQHMGVHALVDASGDSELARKLQFEGACNIKRTVIHKMDEASWFGKKAENPWWMLDTMEIKTSWHPIGF